MIKGKCILNKKVVYSNYYFGDWSDIDGKTLTLLDRNPEGDCLCLVPGKGLIDVDARDVKRVVLEPQLEDILSAITELFKKS